jgi:predicted nucleotidyltransferase
MRSREIENHEVVTVVSRTLGELPGVQGVLLFGSWVARFLGRSEFLPNDIDVLVIGNVDSVELHSATLSIERKLGFPVQTVQRTLVSWLTPSDGLVRTIRSQPVLAVFVNESHRGLVADFEILTGNSMSQVVNGTEGRVLRTSHS